jgi:hypothetical protein
MCLQHFLAMLKVVILYLYHNVIKIVDTSWLFPDARHYTCSSILQKNQFEWTLDMRLPTVHLNGEAQKKIRHHWYA